MYGYLAGLYLHAHVSLLNRTPQEPRAALRTIQPSRPEKQASGPGPGRAGPAPPPTPNPPLPPFGTLGAGPGLVHPPPPPHSPSRRDPFGIIGASEPSELIE
jgi:hypothetical protein